MIGVVLGMGLMASITGLFVALRESNAMSAAVCTALLFIFLDKVRDEWRKLDAD